MEKGRDEKIQINYHGSNIHFIQDDKAQSKEMVSAPMNIASIQAVKIDKNRLNYIVSKFLKQK